MKKFVIITTIAFTSLSAFADNNKVGSVFLNGNALNISIQERSANGSIQIGNEVFRVTSGGPKAVEGQATATVNGKVTKDLNVTIQFQAATDQELKQFVDNKADVKCDSQSNSTVLVSNNLKGTVIGNCAILKNK